MSSNGVEVGGIGAGGGVGVGAGKGYGTSVIDFGDKPLGEEAVGFGEGGGDKVGKDFDNALCLGVRGRGGANREERSRGIGEGGDSFKGVVCLSRKLFSRVLLDILALGAPPGAGRLGVDGEMFRLVIRVLGGRGKI